MIGDEAEEIAWVWCTIRRDSITLIEPFAATDRNTSARIALTDTMVGDIATLWAADTVEQIARMEIDERGFARGLGRVLHRARPVARAAAEALTDA